MHKNSSFASHAVRLIAAASLACTVATVGCSTDRTPGAGQPQKFAPTTGPTMPSSTPGTEQSRPLNPPMISSYTASPGTVTLRPVDTDAIAVAAAKQSYRGRYLGVVNPSGAPSYATNPQSANFETGQFINPAQFTNPQITVNRTISSEPTEVVTGGGSGGAVVSGVATTAGTTSAITAGLVTPTTAATTVSPTTAANTVASATTSTVNTAAPVINNAGGLLTPTMTSAATISPTVASTPGLGNARSSVTTTTATTTNTARTTSALSTANAGSSGSLMVGRTTKGTVTITNISTVGDRLVTSKVTQPVTTTPAPGLRLH